ncbi:MAG: acyl transferase [Flavobacteriaceae bacterium]
MPPIFDIADPSEFSEMALDIFAHQCKGNAVYGAFCKHLGKSPQNVANLEDIPFLPIEFFKSKTIVTGSGRPQVTFTSSGTTGHQTSQHHVTDPTLYKTSFSKGFERFYGPVTNYCILALLPSYLERSGSSLIYMMNDLIRESGHPKSGFYLDNLDQLAHTLQVLETQKTKTLLIGVSFALLDFAEKYPCKLQHTIVMETGGMKGKRRELVREELHAILKSGLGVRTIHSEYGMTELLSQAYSTGDGLFNTPPWMKVLVRDTEDPLSYLPTKKTGGLNIIDLANKNSCSFVATQDLGKLHPDGRFEILGRYDHSDIRGCNLLVL